MLDQLISLDGAIVYLAIFLALMGGAIGLPIPEDLPLVAAGILVQNGSASLPVLFVVCYAGVMIGDLIIFFVGRRLGPKLFSQEWFQKKLPPSKIRRFKLGIERKRLMTIFIARHLFYLRMVTFLTCGAVKMKPSRFILADALAALVSVPLMMTIGYYAAEHYEEIAKNIEIIFLVLFIGLIGFWVFRKRRKPKNGKAAPLSSVQVTRTAQQGRSGSDARPTS